MVVPAGDIVDDQGNRIFSNAEIDALGKKSSIALDRVFDVAQELNGIGSDTIKDLEKNSGAIQPDNLSSG